MLYIADTSALAGTPALIACSMALLEKQSKESSVPEITCLPILFEPRL